VMGRWLINLSLLLLTCTLVRSYCVGNGGQCNGPNWTQDSWCCDNNDNCRPDAWGTGYSSCVAVTPFPAAEPSDWCGAGTMLNTKMLSQPGNVTPRELARIWEAATTGLSWAHTDGGATSCVAAVSIALQECGKPERSDWMTIDDPACNFAMSGAFGVWAVSGENIWDNTLAGCVDATDACCNARLAYAHAYHTGGANLVPAGYCNDQKDCTQTFSGCDGMYQESGPPWNNVQVDRSNKVENAGIPDCDQNCNPWYPNCGNGLIATPSIDQEPCYWGPFMVVGANGGKPYFPGFYGWRGYFQQYMETKAGGECDTSPACVLSCNTEEYHKYPDYYTLAEEACKSTANIWHSTFVIYMMIYLVNIM
jgi:hypothetical protein